MLETHSTLFDFAADLVRTHAQVAFRERPIDPPEFPASRLSRLCRAASSSISSRLSAGARSTRDALVEALPESDGYDRWLARAVDANVDDAEIGRTARALILAYLARVAAGRGEELTEEIA